MTTMSGHEKQDDRAQRRAREALATLGREVHVARLHHDLSQSAAGRAIGVSRSRWSRIELGEATGLSVLDLARTLSVVGLDLHVRAYPGGPPLRDRAHVELLERLRILLGRGARWRTEVPLPNPGDRRAWDALILIEAIRIGVEAETRARDSQELQRRLVATPSSPSEAPSAPLPTHWVNSTCLASDQRSGPSIRPALPTGRVGLPL